MTERIVLATANPDKVVEITSILGSITLEPRPPGVPDVVEDADTLEGNARLKAAAICAATGQAALADDTGLEVVALDGRPGVHTARFAGEHATYDDNVQAMLDALVGVEDRRARFRTVALLHRPDGTELIAEGVLDGVIALERRGSGGFGYDPIFEPVERSGQTLAELEPGEKDLISHRGKAFTQMATLLNG